MTTNHDLSRRAFLGAVAAAGASAWVGDVEAQTPRAPANVKMMEKSSLLKPSDFRYLGLFSVGLDPAGARWGFSRALMTGRMVGGEVRLFMTGSRVSGDPVYEIVVPPTLGLDIQTAPTARFVRNWGDIYAGRRPTKNTAGVNTGGLLWDPKRNGLWWTYGDNYNVTGFHDPSLGFTSLNDATGATAAYGPWRTQQLSQRTRGYLLQIPDSYANSYLQGRNLALSAPLTSGNASSNWGATLLAAPNLDPFTTPPDAVDSTHWTFPCQPLIQHDYEHRMPRQANYMFCGYGYQAGGGCETAWLKPGATGIAGTLEGTTGAAWVQLPDKHGVVFMGSLTWPNTVNATPHYWYLPRGTCCHNQTDPYWEATGDGCGGMRPFWWIYEPSEFLSVVKGSVSPWTLTPDSTIELYSSFAPRPLWDRVKQYYVGGAFVDAAARRLYMSGSSEDFVTNRYDPRPVVHVFQIL